MSRFPTAGHLISWAGLCPRNDESAGKRRSTRLRQGAPWLKTTLVQCAWSASRKKASYPQAQFHRLRARRGAKKAVCAVAASILTAAYHMLRDGTLYQDLGPDRNLRSVLPGRLRPLAQSGDAQGFRVQLFIGLNRTTEKCRPRCRHRAQLIKFGTLRVGAAGSKLFSFFEGARFGLSQRAQQGTFAAAQPGVVALHHPVARAAACMVTVLMSYALLGVSDSKASPL